MSILTSIWEAANNTIALMETYLGEIDKVNKEPTHDSTQDIDADLWNKGFSALAELGLRTRAGCAPVRYSFEVANMLASQTDLALAVAGGDAARLSIPLWRGAAIVGVAYRLEGAQSAGTLTIDARIAATKIVPLQIVAAGTDQVGRSNQLPADALALATGLGAALDALDVFVTTDGAFAAGATPSLWVDVYVSYGGEHEAL